MDFLQCGDEFLRVLDSGGSEPAILFLGGNLLAAEVWQHQLAAEELSHWRRVALDLPGHGDSKASPHPETRYSLPGYADLLKQLVTTLGLERIVVVGHSLGGHVALEAAPSLPQLAGIVIFGTPPLSGPQDMAKGFKETPLMEYVSAAQLSEAQAEEWAAGMLAPGVVAPAWMPRALRQVHPQARPLLVEGVMEHRMRDEVESLRTLDCPPAIVHGQHEALVELEYLEALPLSLWRNGVQVIEGAGHVPQWEEPARFNRVLRAYMDELG